MRKLNASNASGHKTIRKRNMKKFNEEAFLADVAKVSWEGVVSVTKTSTQWWKNGQPCSLLS